VPLARIESCRRCGLSAHRKYVVKGRGDLPCDLLMIGEAPGRTENLTGIAFHGRAGKLLDRMILAAKLDQYRIYITNCLMCRPCEGILEPNREPRAEEVLMCAENLQRVVRQAQARAVVLMGKVAERYCAPEFPFAIKMYHPSYLLRSGEEASPDYWRTIRVMESVHRRLNHASA
jgi:uracil-DNA glycosylase